MSRDFKFFAVVLLVCVLAGVCFVLAAFEFFGASTPAPQPMVAKQLWYKADIETLEGFTYSMVCEYVVNRRHLIKVVRENSEEGVKPGDKIRSTCTVVKSTGGGA